MKRKTLFAASLVIAASAVVPTVGAHAEEEDLQFTERELSEMGYSTSPIGTVLGYNVPKGGLAPILPDLEANGDKFTTIRTSLFRNKGITSIRLPKYIVTISDEAFNGNNLTEITFPESIGMISTKAFANNKLTEITLPKNLKTLGPSAFSDNNLRTVTILADNFSYTDPFPNNPEGLTIIGKKGKAAETLAKTYGYNFMDITHKSAFGFIYEELEDGLKIISTSNTEVFLDVPSAILGKPVIEIAEGAFKDSNLSEINLPETLKVIGKDAFKGNLLKNISIPKSVTSIGAYAFENNLLQKVTLGDNISSIGNFAFTNQFSDESKTTAIPNSSVTIQGSAGTAVELYATNPLMGHDFRNYNGEVNTDGASSYDLSAHVESGEFKVLAPRITHSTTFKLGDPETTTSLTNGETVSIYDNRGTQEGWYLTVSALPFVEETTDPEVTPYILPEGTIMFNRLNDLHASEETESKLPLELLATENYGIQKMFTVARPIDSESGAVHLYSAGENKGMGIYSFNLPRNAITLHIDPVNTKIRDSSQGSTFTSTITWNLVSGPSGNLGD